MQNNIGEARRSYALLHGKFTQDDAARFFGVASSTYKGWEQGIGKLNGEVLCAIADKYECSTDYLLCRTDDPTPYPAIGKPSIENTEEDRLLHAFRQCTPREKTAVMDTVEAMAERGSAKNMDDKSTSRAIGA